MTTAEKAAALLDRLRALAQEATPGPWSAGGATPPGAKEMWPAVFPAERGGDPVAYCGAGGRDAAYIAAANPGVILELVEALRYSLVDGRGEPRVAVVSALARAYDALEPEGGA